MGQCHGGLSGLLKRIQGAKKKWGGDLTGIGQGLRLMAGVGRNMAGLHGIGRVEGDSMR